MRLTITLPLFLAVLSAGCGTGDGPPEVGPPETGPPAAGGDGPGGLPPPAGVATALEALRSGESDLLGGRAPGVTRPAWDRLLFVPRNGTPLVLEDRVEREELAWAHVLRGRIELLDAYLVELVYYPEGGRFLLVDAETGRTTTLDAPPAPSPDGTRFITTSLDLVAGHQPNRIRIYRTGAEGPELEWSLEPKEWGARSPEWLDERTVLLERGTVDWSRTPLEMRWAPMRIEGENGGWRVVS